jgi:hypothetical protein
MVKLSASRVTHEMIQSRAPNHAVWERLPDLWSLPWRLTHNCTQHGIQLSAVPLRRILWMLAKGGGGGGDRGTTFRFGFRLHRSRAELKSPSPFTRRSINPTFSAGCGFGGCGSSQLAHLLVDIYNR